MAVGVAGQAAALLLHFVRGLPSADDDFTHPPHGLAVAAHHADRTQVVQDVFGRDGFFADAAFGKGQVFGDAGIQVVADHQHVHMLIERVVGEGHGRVGRAGQKVRLTHHLQNVGRMAAPRAFGVKGAQAAPPRGFDGVFHIA